MENLLEFLSLQDPNVRFVVLGMVLLGISSGMVGTFTFLRKRALVGDAIAHSVLPGVCLAFMIVQTRDPLILLIGAVITGWLSLILMDFITAKSRIKSDAAIGLVLSVFFGIGILLLTMIQKSGNAAQAGLDSFLFGKAASLVREDVITFSVVSVILILSILFLYKELKLVAFDINFAKVSGLPVRLLELILATLTVLAVAIGIQAVGVVLMAAMLITPATAARYWTNRLGMMLFLAALFGAIAGISGAYISYTAPGMPTGPWIVVVVSFIAVGSLIISPKKGIWARVLKARKNRRKILRENILKTFFQMGEANSEMLAWRTIEELQQKRETPLSSLKLGLNILKRKGYLEQEGDKWRLTSDGVERSRRVVKLHRLWELYLTTYMQIAPDHVHDDADAIEHIITPELEKALEELLQYPARDPHQSVIPYQTDKS